MDINKAIQIGRFSKDPELKYLQSGQSVCNFSLAVDYSYVKDGEKKKTVSFFNYVAWGKQGEAINQYCKKGHRIAVESRPQQRIWEDKDGKKHYEIDFVVEGFEFLQPKEKTEQPVDTPVDTPQGSDDIPF